MTEVNGNYGMNNFSLGLNNLNTKKKPDKTVKNGKAPETNTPVFESKTHEANELNLSSNYNIGISGLLGATFSQKTGKVNTSPEAVEARIADFYKNNPNMSVLNSLQDQLLYYEKYAEEFGQFAKDNMKDVNPKKLAEYMSRPLSSETDVTGYLDMLSA